MKYGRYISKVGLVYSMGLSLVFGFSPAMASSSVASETVEIKQTKSQQELKKELSILLRKSNAKFALYKNDAEKKGLVKRELMEKLNSLKKEGLSTIAVFEYAAANITNPALKKELEAKVEAFNMSELTVADAGKEIGELLAKESNKAAAWSSSTSDGEFGLALVIIGLAIWGLAELLDDDDDDVYVKVYDDVFPDGTPCDYGEYYYDYVYDIYVYCGDDIFFY